MTLVHALQDVPQIGKGLRVFEQAIAVRELNATAHLALQHDQLLPEAAFSASSRLVDLNNEAKSPNKKHSSATIVADV
jgi:hypothetical protein